MIAQPVLIGEAIDMSLRVIPSMLLHNACLTAKGEGCCNRLAGSEIVAVCRTVGCGGRRYGISRRVCIVLYCSSTITQLISRPLSDTISNTV